MNPTMLAEPAFAAAADTVRPETQPLSSRRPLGSWANGMHMTAEEFDAANDWGDRYRYELLHGVLIVSPPAGIGERSPNDLLGHLLWEFQDRHSNGRLLDGTVAEETVATNAGRRQMDRAIWIGLGRTPRSLRDVPTIGVEFVSDSSRNRHRDLITKRDEYLAIGMQEYWLIDRCRRQLTVCRPHEMLMITESEVYQSPLLPGFELPLARLLQVADDWTGAPLPESASESPA